MISSSRRVSALSDEETPGGEAKGEARSVHLWRNDHFL